MSKKGATKSGNPDPGRKNKNSAMAKMMAKLGVKRTSYRDPISGKIVPIGTYPGMPGRRDGKGLFE